MDAVHRHCSEQVLEEFKTLKEENLMGPNGHKTLDLKFTKTTAWH